MRRNSRRQAVLLFGEDRPAKKLAPAVLGGKGAGLAEMARMGVPVPPGFTVTTTVARAMNGNSGRFPRRLEFQLDRGMEALERATGKGFGDLRRPLLVSVRSGAAVSMPGMMDTVLNLGLNPQTVRGLIEDAGSDHFAWDCYRRFLALFGEVVLNIPRERFEVLLAAAKKPSHSQEDRELSAETLEELCGAYRKLIEREAGRPVPDNPWHQLEQVLAAVMDSWSNPRAVMYRKTHGIPDWWGTAVNVQVMVFGNRDRDSGTGVVFSRDVRTGTKGLYGEFLPQAQGEDVVSGARTPLPIDMMKAWNPAVYAELDRIVRQLEDHYQDVVDVEFTVESGRLYILQSRVAKRTPEASATIAVHNVWDKRWTREEALTRVSAEQVQSLTRSGFEAQALKAAEKDFICQGYAASPGAAVGKVALSSAKAKEMAKAGDRVVLVRPDTSPDDLDGMLASDAIVTFQGGGTCHAAVVARGLGKPTVVGAPEFEVREGETISVDGATGKVYRGAVKRSGSTQKKEVNIFLRWLERARPPWRAPRPVFEYVEEQVSVHQLLADFYLSDSMARESAGSALRHDTEKLRRDVHQDVAERIATYLLVAVAGELRHSRDTSTDEAAIAARQKLQDEFGVGYRAPGRSEAQDQTTKKLATLPPEKQTEFLLHAIALFNQGRWEKGYGGEAWGGIAQAVLRFLEGELTHSVFADHAFDLQHNNGTVFGKHKMLAADTGTLGRQLNEKKHADSVLKLRERFAYSGALPSPRVQEVFMSGINLGVWAAK